MIDESRVRELLGVFPAKNILVLGDLMLDEFLWGKVSRISPEAPVPVVDIVREEFFPGGAANVARNLVEFTPGTSLLGVIGSCQHGDRLRQLLSAGRINTDAVQAHSEYRTIVKSRVIARHQHVVRIDRESRLGLRAEHAELALQALERALPGLDAVIVEDYGKGLLTAEFAEQVCSQIRAAGKILSIDPNPGNPLSWRGATVIKPNRLEAFAAAGIPYVEPSGAPMEDVALQRVAEALMEKWDCRYLLITLGEQGVLLLDRDGSRFHAPTKAQEVFDVSGAGDTVIALFTLALASGANPAEAAEIANHASGVVVGKLGTATVQPEELLRSFQRDAA